MKNKNVQIPYELFLLLLQYHLMEYRQNEEKNQTGSGKEDECHGRKRNIQQIQNCTYGRRTRKISERISGQERNTRRLSMVTSLLMVL